jgi:FlaA1/EpsC-like NDP-sugar epimerase
MTHPKSYYKNKVVCVTGAGGSIGSEICRRLVEYEAARIIMVGHSEIGLYETEKKLRDLAPAGAIVTVLASITDARLMERMIEDHGVEILINAAAHKHVPLCEQNPFGAILNNVGGTMTLARAAARFGVKHFIQISTDKAVKPASIMGATKRVCELFLEFFSSRTSMKITTVRFGNVLNSSGSVLPLWREQLRQGKPITLTDRRCTRFFMSIPEAVDLTLGAGSLSRAGLYVLDMGEPKSLHEMAYDLLAERPWPDAPRTPANCAVDRRIVETGLRPGEKLTEELSYGGDLVKTALPKVLAVKEHGGRHLVTWSDFDDLLMAAVCRHDKLAKEKLWELVR